MVIFKNSGSQAKDLHLEQLWNQPITNWDIWFLTLFAFIHILHIHDQDANQLWHNAITYEHSNHQNDKNSQHVQHSKRHSQTPRILYGIYILCM